MKNQLSTKKILFIAVVVLVLCWYCRVNTFAAETSTVPQPVPDLDVLEADFTGWQEIDGEQYYFLPETGEMLTGWQKIDGKYYYFTETKNKKGILKKNCIVGTKKTGYYYVDKDGIRTDSDEINAAVEYVLKHTNKDWSAIKKLKACYQSLRNNYKYQHFDGVPKGAELSEYACSLFYNGEGNCYRYASGMACIAAVLGYKVRVNIGVVSSVYVGWAKHGWAQVKNTGKWKLCDVCMKQFMTDHHPVRKYVPKVVYNLTVNKGNVVWVKNS